MKKTKDNKKKQPKKENIESKKQNTKRTPKQSKIKKQKPKEKKLHKKENNKTNTNTKLIIAIIIIAAISLYFYTSTTNPDTSTTDDLTVKKGDKVYLRFTQKLENSTIIGTNDEELAKTINQTRDTYAPLVFIVGEGQVPKGLDNAVIGMKAGEKKTIILTPADAYGEHKPELVGTAERIQKQPRNITVENYESITSDEFTEVFNKRVAMLHNNVSIPTIPWHYTIVDVKPDNITLKAIIKIGTVYRLPDTPYWNSTVIEVTEQDTIFRQNPEKGITVPTKLGNATVTTEQDSIILTINPNISDIYNLDGTPAKVTEINEEHITLDANHPLAGKTIIFDIELLQRAKTNKNTE